MTLANVSIDNIREATKAWRRADHEGLVHRMRSGWLRWFVPAPNMALHDRIDELVAEIERLRPAPPAYHCDLPMETIEPDDRPTVVISRKMQPF